MIVHPLVRSRRPAADWANPADTHADASDGEMGAEPYARACARVRSNRIFRQTCQPPRAGPRRGKFEQARRDEAVGGVGGLIPLRARPCNRLPPHAQIFFPSAKPLIIFFKSKKLNGGALSSAQQCKPSQALRRRVLGRSRGAGWNLRIYFRSQSRRTRGAVKSSVDPGSRTVGLIRTRNLEIEYRKPSTYRPGTSGGLGLKRPSADRGPARAFPRNPNLFFFGSQAAASGAGTWKIAAKFRVGG
jgi:hypothetical protein